MSATTTTTTPDPTATTKVIEGLLINRQDTKDPHGPLWHSWRYLQIYTHYGLKLPHTEADLKTALNIKDPGKYLWFNSALSAYTEIFGICDKFLKNIFPNVVNLGTKLEQFAKDAGGSTASDEGIFSAVIELLDANDDAAALELIQDLAKQAKANHTSAGVVRTELASYKTGLATALGLLKTAKDAVNKDNKVSQDRISKLTTDNASDRETIAGMKKAIQTLRDERQHNIVVATTTVTYCWVPFVGLITAAVVAGIFGAKAEEARKQIESFESMLSKLEDDLRTAVSTHEVLDLASDGLESAAQYTNLADSHATTVQNAWESLTAELENIATKVGIMTKETDGQAKLAAKAVIKVYARSAKTSWGTLVPILRDLTAEPYIRVADGETTFADVLKQTG